MPPKSRRRTQAAIIGDQRSRQTAVVIGSEIRGSRKLRRLTQHVLAERVGISRQRLGDIEAGRGLAVPMQVWFALAEALGRYLRFDLARDPQADVADAGHLAMQELVARVAKTAGSEVAIEAPSRAWESKRSVDVRLTDRTTRQIVVVECWNTFGDLGAAARSGDAKVRDEELRAVAIAGDGAPIAVGLVWLIRDTRANRELLARYPNFFSTRFPGSSGGWLATLIRKKAMPTAPGLLWSDVGGRRIFTRRHSARR